MPRTTRLGPIVALALAIATVLPACSDSPLPGTVLGTYKVVARSQTNSCGLGMPNPWTFDVQLSQDHGNLYWSWLNGTAPISAPLTAPSSATLDSREEANVDGMQAGGLGPCTMDRADSIHVALGTGSPPRSFTGTINYAFTVPSGWDCSDQLMASGGMYEALPCTIAYSDVTSRQ